MLTTSDYAFCLFLVLCSDQIPMSIVNAITAQAFEISIGANIRESKRAPIRRPILDMAQQKIATTILLAAFYKIIVSENQKA